MSFKFYLIVIFCRIDIILFDEFFEKVRFVFEKKNINMRDVIFVYEMLCVILRFLVFGSFYGDFM